MCSHWAAHRAQKLPDITAHMMSASGKLTADECNLAHCVWWYLASSEVQPLLCGAIASCNSELYLP